ncbi:MAG: hypothetical protein NTY35_08040 [Planctomycetota bacterium]|nr:hypothetical protein [Planctomycetota bacterium]
MLKKFVALATIVALSVPISAVEEGTAPEPVEVGISVTSTRFFARNFSGTNQVLLFESGGTLLWRTLAPGCDLSWNFPTQLLTGIRFEVASWTGGAWRRTGTIALDQVAARGTDALWIQGNFSRTSWSEIGSALFVEDTGASLFPPSLPGASSAGTGGEAALLAPIHVPVITPSDEPSGDVPPKIEVRPLPPV